MSLTSAVVLAVLGAGMCACSSDTSKAPPVAKVVPEKLEKHGHVRVDNYFWLKDRNNPAVIKYLEAENEYTEAMMAHTKGLQETLFNEFKTRIKQTDISAPYKRDGYYYYIRVEEGREYPVYCRKKGSLEASEQIMLDVNALAKGHGYVSVPPPEVRPKGDVAAYAMDSVGRRFYTLYFRNLETGETLSDVIPDDCYLEWPRPARFRVRHVPSTTDCRQENGGLANGILFSGGLLGGAVALPFFVWPLEFYGWRMAFYLLSVPGIIWTLCWFVWFRDHPRQPVVQETVASEPQMSFGSSGSLVA